MPREAAGMRKLSGSPCLHSLGTVCTPCSTGAPLHPSAEQLLCSITPHTTMCPPPPTTTGLPASLPSLTPLFLDSLPLGDSVGCWAWARNSLWLHQQWTSWVTWELGLPLQACGQSRRCEGGEDGEGPSRHNCWAGRW